MFTINEYLDKTLSAKTEYENGKERYSQLLNIYNNVVTWEYGTWDLYPFEPYYSERYQMPKGRKIKTKDTGYETKHGLDKNGKCIITVSYEVFPNQFYETFFIYDNDFVRSYHYTYSKSKNIINVTEYVLKNNLLLECFSWASRGSLIIQYEYDLNNVKREIFTQPSNGHNMETITERVFEYEYDNKGLLYIKETDYFWYYRINRTELNEYIKLAKDDLIKGITQYLKETIKTKTFRIAILYEEGFCFPPDVAIGLLENVKNRFELISEKEYWNSPCEWGISSKYQNNRELMNKLNNISKISAQKYKLLKEMIFEIVIELNQNIDSIIPISLRSDNFLIVASDFDGEDIEKNIQIIQNKLELNTD